MNILVKLYLFGKPLTFRENENGICFELSPDTPDFPNQKFQGDSSRIAVYKTGLIVRLTTGLVLLTP